MREIKFRAWDKHIEVMVEPEDLQLDGSGLVARYYQNCDDEDSIWVTDSISLKEIILLQYTGLKDKNGKEIYEGDILSNGNGIIHAISFHDGAFFWGGAPMNIVKQLEDIYPVTYKYHYVIGNIYENPELMREESNDTSDNKGTD